MRSLIRAFHKRCSALLELWYEQDIIVLPCSSFLSRVDIFGRAWQEQFFMGIDDLATFGVAPHGRRDSR